MAKPVPTPFGQFLLPAAVARDLAQEQMIALAGGYEGASRRKRSLSEWQTRTMDADAALLWDLPTLRDRSSDLIRNNPLAAGAINTKVTSVIGSGLWHKAAINREYLGIPNDQADELEAKIEFEFSVLCKDMGIGGESFTELQRVAYRSGKEKGDSFALLTGEERIDNPYQLAVQLIESERVSNPDDQRDCAELAGGIKKNGKGRHTHYCVQTSHPGSTNRKSRKWVDIPARNSRGRRIMLHIYRPLRPEQTRGAPDLAPVIEPLKQLGRYTEAELMAAVVSGMYTVFIKSEGDGDGEIETTDIKLGNGSVVGLAPGESIETTSPGRPNAGFDPFFLAITRQIGVALELPFEILIKHFSSSYSASRAAMLEAWRYFSSERSWFAEVFCQPIKEAFVDEGVALGRFNMPGYFDDPFIRAAYVGSRWSGPPRGHVDELKEAKASQIYNELGVKTLDEITMEVTGGDWESSHAQLAKETRKRKEDGLPIATGQSAGFFMPGENNEEGN